MWDFMGEKATRGRKLWDQVRQDVSIYRQTRRMPPKYVIKINHALYFFTLLFLAVSVVRLVLHIVFEIHAIPPNNLFLGVVAIVAIILWISRYPRLSLLIITLGSVVWVIFQVLSQIPQWNMDLFLAGYQCICDICTRYAQPTVLVQIFLSMGFINFSLSYMLSVRDKPFYGVSLGSVLQEQFPEHGQMFVFYTCLILIGLYSSGMNYHIVALTCLSGAILSLVYTSYMSMLFTFSQLSKQAMVEYYLVHSPVPPPSNGQKIEAYTSFNRLLAASDYINAYYKANGSVPQEVSANLWKRLFDCQQYLLALSSPNGSNPGLPQAQADPAGSPPVSSAEHPYPLQPGDQLENLAIYTRLVICAAAAWRHILQDLPPDQQSETICYVLQAGLRDKPDFLQACESFISAEDSHFRKDMETPLRDALPLCGLISYLRSKNNLSIDAPGQYWNDFEKCFQSVYRIRLVYSRTAVQMGYTYALDAIPQILFLLLEATLLIEASSLEKDYYTPSPDYQAFWIRLKKRERGFQLTARDCSWFSDWALGIVCSYKIDWFRSHEGMLSAYLIYQQLFHMLRQDGGAYDAEDEKA